MTPPLYVPESAILDACLEYLKVSRRAFAWRQNSGGMKVDDRYVNFCGAKGASDIIGVLRCGHGLAVECKSSAGRVTELQADFLACVRLFHGVGLIVRNVDELVRELDAHDQGCVFQVAKRAERRTA